MSAIDIREVEQLDKSIFFVFLVSLLGFFCAKAAS